MSSPHITYSARADALPEAEVSVLGAVYKFVLDCRAKKEATPESRPDDGTKFEEDSANERIIQ